MHLDQVVRRSCVILVAGICLDHYLFAQRSFSWQEIRDKFEATNPTLRALQIGIDENKAQEITAYLRPNPDFTLASDVQSRRQVMGAGPVFCFTFRNRIFPYCPDRFSPRCALDVLFLHANHKEPLGVPERRDLVRGQGAREMVSGHV